jgi:hypothetical protein
MEQFELIGRHARDGTDRSPVHNPTFPKTNESLRWLCGYIAQWLERLTADQQVPGSNPGVPFCL